MGVRSKGAIIARGIILHSINIVSIAFPLSDQVFNAPGNNLRVFVDL